jgi:hypothetical protein
VSDVVRDEEPCSGADRCGEDRDVLRVRERPRAFTIVCCRAVDLDRDDTKELLEEWRGLGEFRREIPPNFRHGGFRKHETKEPELDEDQDRVAGARAGQQSGDQDVSIDTNG